MAWLKTIETRTTAGIARLAEAPLIVWGDDQAGYVSDVINMMSDKMVLATISLPPGAFYRYSAEKKTLYDGDACFYVLAGEYTLHACDTGEVLVAGPGEVITLKGPQWHFGYNFAECEVRVLEIIAPPPSAAAYAEIKAPDAPMRGVVEAALADFPSTSQAGMRKLRHIRRDQSLAAIVGDRNPLRMRAFASGRHVSVAEFDLLAGKRSDVQKYAAAVSVFALSGALHVHNVTDDDWQRLQPEDSYYLPSETEWRLFNFGDATTSALLAVAGNLGQELC